MKLKPMIVYGVGGHQVYLLPEKEDWRAQALGMMSGQSAVYR